MKKYVITAIALLFVGFQLSAQVSKEYIYSHIGASGGVYYAYPEVTTKPTAAPKGYEAFYISHYGRHGSRYLIGDNDYLGALRQLRSADQAGALTPLGEDVLRRVEIIFADAEGKGGSLTTLGVKQHRGIAERMVANYPAIFRKGTIDISARSTTVPRCILSMDAFCERLKEINPSLNITRESCDRYMNYLNYHTEEAGKFTSSSSPWQRDYAQFEKENVHPERLVKTLFKSEDYIRNNVRADRLMWGLYWIASDIQDVELGDITLYDIFEIEELYDLWKIGNAKNYINDGPSPLSNGVIVGCAGNLLRNIVDSADEAIASGKMTATLRFGHDGNIQPLASILHLDGCNIEETDYNKIDRAWSNFRVSPMASNIQISFYRNKKNHSDILVKFMLNEQEIGIPVKTDKYPYYNWNDVRAFYVDILSKLGI